MANIDTLYKAQFGQYGSVFTSVSGALTAPENRVFVAIQIIADCKFDTNGGLIADTSNPGLVFPTTLDGDGNAVYTQLYGGDAIDSDDIFLGGTTIIGRWTEIDLTQGSIIAYIGV